jgi:hypothetical protein
LITNKIKREGGSVIPPLITETYEIVPDRY